jgi:ABC-type multidrug transport system fused ATPase/permease subunit
MALGAFVILPLSVLASAVGAKYDPNKQKYKKQETATDESQILANDCILNFRTVSSFGSDEILMKEYEEHLRISKITHDTECKKAGFAYGGSQFNTNLTFAGLQLWGGWLAYNDPTLNGAYI